MFKFICVLTEVHLAADAGDQGFPALLRVLDMLFFYVLLEVLDDRHGGLDPHIAHDQGLLKLLIEIVINRGEAGKDGIHSGHNVFSGLCETFDEAREKAFFLLFHTNPPYFKSFSIRFTETSVDTPFSCIVIP